MCLLWRWMQYVFTVEVHVDVITVEVYSLLRCI